ncbi:uncharacterized protein LOC131957765 [Physella acuta]|uniref:uncharacterized protein LOC131957765 n=1 Tax=Physella acuta TaxID=109671 RepID=UPI0027DD8AAA|nr:uncharacterized protein LOC131957765 [Physella acuta]
MAFYEILYTMKVHSQECSTDFDCEELFSCIDYKNSGKKCLCRDGLYYTQTSGCTPITQLQVQTPSVQSRTTSSIYITWSINAGIPANVNYKIQVGSLAPITASSTGGDVTGLSPGQQYTLWIVSTLPANSYYPDLNTNVSVAFWTSGEEVNYTALAIGLGIGLPCIIIIIIVAAICINRHLRNKKLEAMRRQEPRYNTPSRTFQDDHLYGVSNENMTPVISEPDQVSQPARNGDDGDVYDEIPDYIN